MSDEGTSTLGKDRIESLRLILEHEQSRSIAYDEALEIGESLISFYEVLADDASDIANQPLISTEASSK